MILEEHGRFWWHHEVVPDGHFAPENSVTGTLAIDDEGRAKLTLHEALLHTSQSKDIMSANNQIPETVSIQGRLNETGRHVVLGHLRSASMKFSSYGTFEAFRAEYSLVGGAGVSSSMPQMMVSSLAVELNGFEEWLRLAAIQFSREENCFSAIYRKEEDPTYKLDGGTLRVNYELYSPWGEGKRTEIEVRQAASVKYAATEPLSLKDTVKHYQLLQDLLTLLTNSNYSLGFPEVTLAGIEASYNLYFRRIKGKEEAPKQFEAWIDFPELKPILGKVFSAWIAKREIFGPAFYLFLGTRRGQPQYLENRFLNLVVGIEAFHRQKFPEHVVSTKLAEKIERIIGDVKKSNDRRWLRGQLEHAAEPSLEERLDELIKTLPFSEDAAVIRDFAKGCAKLRNDISHFGGRHRRSDYDAFLDETWARSDVIAFYYQALILREIGLSEEVLTRWLRTSTKAYPLKVQMSRFRLCENPASAAARAVRKGRASKTN